MLNIPNMGITQHKSNQLSDPNKTPINKKTPINNNKLNFILPIKKNSCLKKGINKFKIEKSKVPYKKNIKEKEISKHTSPTLFTNKALKADFTA